METIPVQMEILNASNRALIKNWDAHTIIQKQFDKVAKSIVYYLRDQGSKLSYPSSPTGS